MEIESQGSPSPESTFQLHARAKSSVRMHYEAQVEVIRRQIGDLEKIRENLGLSRRKICQLLMVDPSAWTRWTKDDENPPPPHIYRALQWFMILQEKLPGLTPQYFVGKDPEVLHRSALMRIEAEASKRAEFEEAAALQSLKLERQLSELGIRNQDLQKSNHDLKIEVGRLKKRLLGMAFVFTIVTMAFVTLLFKF